MSKIRDENVLFLRAWWDLLSPKSPEFRHAILDALFTYAFTGERPDFPPESALMIAFEYIANHLDNNREELARKREQGRARWRERTGGTRVALHAGGNMDKDMATATDMKTDTDMATDMKKTLTGDSDTHSLPPENNSASEGERGKIIFEYALYLLSQGRISAYSSAAKAYDYFESVDWVVNGRQIKYKAAYLRSREKVPPAEFVAAEGELMARILRKGGVPPGCEAWIDRFRGFRRKGNILYFVFTSCSSPVTKFTERFNTDKKFNKAAYDELDKVYTGIERCLITNL